MDITTYIDPGLLVLVPALYLIAEGLKSAKVVKDSHIPLTLGAAGVLLAALWVLSTTPVATVQDSLTAAFTAAVQGILCAGAAVYAHQVGKQMGRQ